MSDYYGYSPAGNNYTSSSYTPGGYNAYGTNYGGGVTEAVTTTNTTSMPVTNTQVLGGGIETNFGTNVADGFFGGGQAAVTSAGATSGYVDYGGNSFFGGGPSQVVTTLEQQVATPMTTVVETRRTEPISTTVTTNYNTTPNYGSYNAYEDYSANLYDYTDAPKPASCCNLRNICLGLLGLLLLGALLGGLIWLLRFFMRGANSQTIPSHIIPQYAPQEIITPQIPIVPPPIVLPTPSQIVVKPPVIPVAPIVTPIPVIPPPQPIVKPIITAGSTNVLSSVATVLPYSVTTTTSIIRPPSIVTLKPIKVAPIIVPSKPIIVPNKPIIVRPVQPDVSIVNILPATDVPQLNAVDINQLLLIRKQYGGFDANTLAKLGIPEAQYRAMILNASNAGLLAPAQLDLLSLPAAQATTIAALTHDDIKQLLLLSKQNGGINPAVLGQLNLSEAQYSLMLQNAYQAGILKSRDMARIALPVAGARAALAAGSNKLFGSLGAATSRLGSMVSNAAGAIIGRPGLATSNNVLETLSNTALPTTNAAGDLIFRLL